MHPVPIMFGVASVVTLLVATFSHDRDLIAFAALLAGYWVAANSAWFENLLWLLPIMDWLLLVVAVGISIENGAKWPRMVIAICGMRLGAHLLYELGGADIYRLYANTINALFALLLLVVAEPGVKNGVGLLRGWFGRNPLVSRRTAHHPSR